eukprot:6186376-Pleurochrysis_carterae.AAC.7
MSGQTDGTALPMRCKCAIAAGISAAAHRPCRGRAHALSRRKHHTIYVRREHECRVKIVTQHRRHGAFQKGSRE